jgi:hypothetical protein
MRVYKKSDNLIKLSGKDRTIYVSYKNFNLIDIDYFKNMIKPIIVNQFQNYIIMTGTGYNIKILCFDDLDLFLEGCCGVFGIGLSREDILKYI